MNPPIIRQISRPQSRFIKKGWLWWRKTIEITTYVPDYSDKTEIREFTKEFEAEIIKHFEENPPRVGDRIFIECAYRIIKVFYNFNHKRYEIWWVYDPNFDMVEVRETKQVSNNRKKDLYSYVNEKVKLSEYTELKS